ncbi:sodium:solute symporter [Bacteroidota bacterium]
MVSFSDLDVAIILIFFGLVLLTGFISGYKQKDTSEDYLLSGRKVGLFLFVLTNVATWYGGILGVGEFTYRYGLISWFTQGFPYYVFAIIFALFFAKKIRNASLFTIPDKLEQTYGKTVGLISSLLIFILVSPAPYLLMIGSLLSLIFDIPLIWSLIIGVLLSAAYLFKGGYRSDVYTDALGFFVMFIGFIIIVAVALLRFGGIEFLESNLPAAHLNLTGDVSPTFIIVWFLIALWTFTDPGFHQRCYAAESGKIAVKGILISIIFWALFDFLTTATGLFARASIMDLENPVLAFPMLAEKILGPGLKGIFYAALFATILSTLNSFLFISATTFGRDFIYKMSRKRDEQIINRNTRIGLLAASALAITMAYTVNSVIELWYLIGSIVIPSIIILVITSYYQRFKISNKGAVIEILAALTASISWLIIRPSYVEMPVIGEIEPMIIGLFAALVIHLIFWSRERFSLEHNG